MSNQKTFSTASGLECIPQFSAVALSRTVPKDDYLPALYNTDLETLRSSERRAREAVASILSGIQSIGLLVAYADTNKVQEHTIQDAAFFVAGLSSLADWLSREADGMRYHLTALRHLYEGEAEREGGAENEDMGTNPAAPDHNQLEH